MKLVFSAFFLLLGQAYAACSHHLSTPNIAYIVGENNPTTTNTVSIARNGNAPHCADYFITFGKGGATNYGRKAVNGGSWLAYNLYKSSDSTGVLKDQGDITNNSETIFGTLGKNQNIVTNYYFAIAPINASQPPKFGNYTDTVMVRSFSGTWGGSNALEKDYNLNVTIIVPKLIYLSLLSSGDSFDSSKTSKVLDFGELEQNEELSFDIKLVSNAGYTVNVSSANNGKLKHLSATGANGVIDYELYVSNAIKNLGSSAESPVAVASATGLTPAGGATLPIKVRIGSVENRIEGDYEDVVTITVVTTD